MPASARHLRPVRATPRRLRHLLAPSRPRPARRVPSATSQLQSVRLHYLPAGSYYARLLTNRPSSKLRSAQQGSTRYRCTTRDCRPRRTTTDGKRHADPAERPAERQTGHLGTPRTDTRSRVQKVALELFAEQGYEKTSLREIAERLAVTKAALYYHFRSKEDIVHSFTDDYFAEIDALVEWAKDQPAGDETRRAILDRYVGIVLARQRGVPLPGAKPGRDAGHGGRQGPAHPLPRSLDALVDLLAGPMPRCGTGYGPPRPSSRSARPACSTCSGSTTRTSCERSSWKPPST